MLEKQQLQEMIRGSVIKWRFSLVTRLTTGEQCSPVLSSLNKILLQQQNTALILPFSSCFAA